MNDSLSVVMFRRAHIVRYLVSVIARVYSTVHALLHTKIGVGPGESVKTQGDETRADSRSTCSIRSFDKGPALDELRLQRLEVLTRRVHLRLRIG